MSPERLAALLSAFDLVLPEAVLVLGACVLFLGSTFKGSRNLWGLVALLALGWAGLLLSRTPLSDPNTAEASPLFLDRLAVFFKVMALAGGAVLVLFSWDQVPERHAADYHACLLLIVAGLSLTGSANELVTLFLALELISIPTYVLMYLPKHDPAAQEAAMKYFLLSVFSSALLLFGFSYLYGLSGSTNVPAILEALGKPEGGDDAGRLPAISQAALVLVVAGLCFKIAAVPFHFYAPDVYQGTATPAAALLAFVPKAAGFVALIRLLGFVAPIKLAGPGLVLGQQVPILFWILAAVTMTLGNVLGLLQSNVKRLLAYSSVAHAGYMLIGLTVAPELPAESGAPVGGVETVLFYLVAYAAMTTGAFAVVGYLSTPQRPVETEDDLAGLGRSHPGVALLLALFLFSLLGMPLTAGFFAKMLLFFGAMAVKDYPNYLFQVLAVVAALNAAIGGWYYLRILAKMYLHNPIKPLDRPRSWPALAAIGICAALTLGLGVYPQPLLEQAVKASRSAAATSGPALAHRSP